MKCPYCESGTNDFVPMNQTAEYSGIEMSVNRQGMLRVRVLDDDGGFTTQDIVEIRSWSAVRKEICERLICMSGIIHWPKMRASCEYTVWRNCQGIAPYATRRFQLWRKERFG